MQDQSGMNVGVAQQAAAPTPMSDEEFRTLVGNEIRDALTFIDGYVAPEREINYRYYLGEMDDVPSIPGRSSVVVRVVADYVGFILPSLLRTMIASRKIVEYVSKGTQDEEMAKIATDYVNDAVFRLDNKIEDVCYGWGFDGLVNKVGVVKAWWQDEKEYKDFVLPPMNELQFVMAIIQAEQQGLEVTGHAQDPHQIDPMTGAVAPGLHHLSLRQTIDKSHVKFATLPPEEFVISRDARGLEDARMKTHRTYKYVGELIAQGYDPKIVESLPSFRVGQMSAEALNRQPADTFGSFNTNDPMLKKVAVHEGTILCDKDGTGLKEWYFVAGGWANSVEILEVKEFEDQVYFCDFCPTPLPHLFFGRCPADELIDIQRVQTVLARQIQDNVYLTNAPQQEVVVSQLHGDTLDYVKNKSPGALIPVTAAGTVNNITIPFMGDAALQLMQYWDAQAENRTGASRNTMGLDPNVLQNQSATAAMLQDSASKLKLETIARIWATGGMRKLGRAVLRILKRRQDFQRIVKVNGIDTPVDPRAWAELDDWDVTINTGLGTGDRGRDLQMGTMIIGKMEEILTKLGPNNPLVSLPMYSHALIGLAEAAGLKNPEAYFKPLPMNWQPPPPAPPPPPPQVQAAIVNANATVEAARIKADATTQDAQVENLTSYLLGMSEQHSEAALKAYEIERQAQTTRHVAYVSAAADTNIAKVKGQKRLN